MKLPRLPTDIPARIAALATACTDADAP